MLIVSKFRDYYDKIGASFGVDKTIVFERNPYLTKKIKFNGPSGWSFFNKNKADKVDAEAIELIVVGFCGKTYVGLCHQLTIPDLENTTFYHKAFKKITKFYWGRESIVGFLNRSLEPNEINFLNAYDNSKQWVSVFQEIKAPIFTWNQYITYNLSNIHGHRELGNELIRGGLLDESGNNDDGSSNIAVNNNLSKLNFQSVVCPVQAFQEVQMFISGVLGIGEKPVIEISNNDKIVSQGFDLKTSFRKDTPPTRKQKVK